MPSNAQVSLLCFKSCDELEYCCLVSTCRQPGSTSNSRFKLSCHTGGAVIRQPTTIDHPKPVVNLSTTNTQFAIMRAGAFSSQHHHTNGS
eukprot:1689887-Amphidinium_carterae.1